jgi:hypothetical protein
MRSPWRGRPCGRVCPAAGRARRFGVPSYWVIDPDLEQPSLRAFQLVNGEYVEAARAAGDVPFRAERPFPVEVVPSHLIAKLR